MKTKYLKKYTRGGVLNTDMPDLSSYRAHLPDGFDDWLSKQVGEYRFFSNIKALNGKQTKSDNIKALKELIDILEIVKQIPEILPDMADVLLSQTLYRRHGIAGLDELTHYSQLKRHATIMLAACKDALQELSLMELKTMTGREKDLSADRLFVTVTDRLTCRKLEDRLSNAAAILTLCRVTTSEAKDSSNLLRIYRRKKKELKELRLLPVTKQDKHTP